MPLRQQYNKKNSWKIMQSMLAAIYRQIFLGIYAYRMNAKIYIPKYYARSIICMYYQEDIETLI